jgi:hypothetical protein
MIAFAKKTFRKVLGDKRMYGLRRRLNYPADAFHNDAITLKAVDVVLKSIKPSAFGETGLFQGDTTRYMAYEYPDLSIHSFEINEEFYNSCKVKLKDYPHVHLHLGSSDKALKEALLQRQLGNRPLFYLDAHWYDYWPLQDEIRLIGEHLKESVMFIDDFEVPQRPEFAFDVGGCRQGANDNRKCNLELIKDCFSKNHRYRVFYPKYDKQDAQTSELVGYSIIVQNPDDRWNHPPIADFLERYYSESKL